ncbi:magnesium transporter CorA family protein [Candidatus Nitrosocosmicus franklandus]|uniref:Magnesium transport protein CorA n=1 Tax=Candidatus Nitrosocosmicus franklandianus TaxID=1798806 RepID=A0A484IGV8_9ARCH|nr:CorA family divalent cation transporter [Candidatus Nitrosocosmicus franklandus]VFJ15262.1 Magnesium transport protein CorA [Candidatus Nitrosocosmicus franklandus]
MQKTVFYYNKNEIIEEKTESDDRIKDSHNLWIDVLDPTDEDITNLATTLSLNKKAIDKIRQKSKKPVVKEIDHNDKFIILLHLKFNNFETLETIPLYFHVGDKRLITIHSQKVDLITKVKKILTDRETILETSIDALYYSIISSIIEDYEQLLTAIELKVFDVERDAQYRPSGRVLTYLDTLSRQVIILRRHFWDARNIINYHINMEKDKDDIKYLQIVYDNINQLIEMIQSYQDTINSTRELFSASISLQMNETMRVLTVFSAIVLPLSLILSVLSLDGFNLDNLLDLPRYLGFLLIVMLTITILSLIAFWKKGWIFSYDKEILTPRDKG